MRPSKRSSLPSTTPCTRSVRSSPPTMWWSELTNTCIPASDQSLHLPSHVTQGLCRFGGGRELRAQADVEHAPLPRAQVARQLDRPEADTQQPADLVSDRFPHTPHLAVATFMQDDTVGSVAGFGGRTGPLCPIVALRRRLYDPIEGRGAILQRNAAQEPPKRLLIGPPTHPHQVFALDAARRMHQAMRELAVGGEDEQTRGVDIQPPDHDPAAMLRRR